MVKSILLTMFLALNVMAVYSQDLPVPSNWPLPDATESVVSEVSPFNAPAKFRCVYTRTANSFGYTPLNHVIYCGWNVAAGGGAAVSGQPGLYYTFEYDYKPNATADAQSEFHIDHLSRDGVLRRALVLNANNVTGSFTTMINSQNLGFLDGPNVLAFSMNNRKFFIQPGSSIQSGENNADFLTQYNAAGNGIVKLIKADSNNEIKIGNATVKTNLGPVDVKDTISINGIKVIGQRCAAIADSTGGADDTRAINAIIACLESHGLVAQ